MDDKFLKVAVKSVVKTQVDILAAAKGTKKYDLVGELVDAAWQTAKDAGLVTDVMLESAILATLPHQGNIQPMPSIYKRQSKNGPPPSTPQQSRHRAMT